MALMGRGSGGAVGGSRPKTRADECGGVAENSTPGTENDMTKKRQVPDDWMSWRNATGQSCKGVDVPRWEMNDKESTIPNMRRSPPLLAVDKVASQAPDRAVTRV